MRRRKPKIKPAAVYEHKSQAAPPLHRRRVLTVVFLLSLVLGTWGFIRLGLPGIDTNTLLPPAVDPRLASASPYLNVRPDVHYLGDEACASCHRDLVASFHKHPMGRSLAPIGAASTLERYEEAAHNPFEAAGSIFSVDRRNDRVIHKEMVAGSGIEAEADMAYSIGSGRQGRGDLIDRAGFLFQSPISWYPLKGIWDLSPGYEEFNKHFNRPIVAECLFCHVNRVEPDAHAANFYHEPVFRGFAIGCERCHGPGELHVKQRKAGEPVGGVDLTIVNPRHLEHSLREAVCQQCHLQSDARVLARGRASFEFRPGLPLNKFLADFVKPPDEGLDKKFVGTVEQMYASRCFRASAGADKLGCISCHDPHALPSAEERESFYRNRCMNCHAQKGCTLPKAERLAKNPNDSCIACHMPTLGSTVPHTVVTNHTIPRHGDARLPESRKGSWPQAGQLPLLPFPPALAEVEDPEQTRNLGIALVEMARKQERGGTIALSLAQFAVPLLDGATTGDPKDVDAWEAKASALMVLDRLEPALAACEKGLEVDADREITLYLAAHLANGLGRPAVARSYCERGIKVDPWQVPIRQELADSYVRERNLDKVVEVTQEIIKIDPFSTTARQLQIQALLERGDKDRARREATIYQKLLPAQDRPAFQGWFDQQMGQGKK